MAHLYPPLMTGDSGEDTIELLCSVSVTENVTLDYYQFEWSKDGSPIDLSYYHTIMVSSYSVHFGYRSIKFVHYPAHQQ